MIAERSDQQEGKPHGLHRKFIIILISSLADRGFISVCLCLLASEEVTHFTSSAIFDVHAAVYSCRCAGWGLR